MRSVLFLHALDVFFFAAHSALIAFILAGWAWKKTRPAHLGVCLLTGFSWGVLGFWYGFGYCPCTEWHWRVRMALGAAELPQSYIKYLIDAATGLDASAYWVDAATAFLFLAASFLSIALNLRDWRWKSSE